MKRLLMLLVSIAACLSTEANVMRQTLPQIRRAFRNVANELVSDRKKADKTLQKARFVLSDTERVAAHTLRSIKEINNTAQSAEAQVAQLEQKLHTARRAFDTQRIAAYQDSQAHGPLFWTRVAAGTVAFIGIANRFLLG